ncbi:hypothetical protein PIB30_107586 [Stylosanthes scabra]|uniref:Transmembrane protein n=1 Tax=Stylosanthes scabra TaxID=79078 RepID=A0ABU6SZM2_9FABA|nr:hypothetical protein [Stylosanthes scabra]
MNSEFRATNSEFRPVNSGIRPLRNDFPGSDEYNNRQKRELLWLAIFLCIIVVVGAYVALEKESKQEERKEGNEMRVVVVVPPFGGRNFHTRAPIDAPFAATRSSRLPLRFYPNN